METTLTTNFTPEKEVIEITPYQIDTLKAYKEFLEEMGVPNKEIPAKEEEPEKRDVPTVH